MLGTTSAAIDSDPARPRAANNVSTDCKATPHLGPCGQAFQSLTTTPPLDGLENSLLTSSLNLLFRLGIASDLALLLVIVVSIAFEGLAKTLVEIPPHLLVVL